MKLFHLQIVVKRKKNKHGQNSLTTSSKKGKDEEHLGNNGLLGSIKENDENNGVKSLTNSEKFTTQGKNGFLSGIKEKNEGQNGLLGSLKEKNENNGVKSLTNSEKYTTQGNDSLFYSPHFDIKEKENKDNENIKVDKSDKKDKTLIELTNKYLEEFALSGSKTDN